eukprot:COSAG06_NODE_7499_length_2483_cov_1.323826_1_plen_78_part_00
MSQTGLGGSQRSTAQHSIAQYAREANRSRRLAAVLGRPKLAAGERDVDPGVSNPDKTLGGGAGRVSLTLTPSIAASA